MAIKKFTTIGISIPHFKLLTFMVTLISMSRKETKTNLVERLIVTYAKQLTVSIKDDVYRGKLLSLINDADRRN